MNLLPKLSITARNQLSPLHKTVLLLLPMLFFFGMAVIAAATPLATPYKYEEILNKADTSEPKVEEVFKVVEEMPRFPGCEEMDISEYEKKMCAQQKLLEFIYEEIKYPEEAKQNKIEGMTVVSFIVEKDGSVSHVELVRNVKGGCGEEAARVVELMNERGIKWVPGKQRGRKVRVQFNLPVKFALNDDEKKSKPDFDKIKKAKEDPNYVFTETEEMPFPVQCNDRSKSMDNRKKCTNEAIETARKKHYNYPKSAKKQGIKGSVLVEFIIEKDGTISNEKAVRMIGGGLDEEALNIVRAMHREDLKWTPGKIDGKPVRTRFFISIPFD